ncbi:MAG: hypothetical protein ACTSYA_02060 [Candidatus Kariarchaeaceae archaeon]
MRKLTITFSMGLFLILLGSITAVNTVAVPNYTGERTGDNIWIRTPQITVKIAGDKPNIVFWDSSQNDSTGVYSVWIHSITELFGDDLVLDDRTELAGQYYNLIAVNWSSAIEETETELTVSLISEALTNGAVVKFIFHAYFVTELIEETQIATDDTTTVVTHEVKALSEVKFDIIVENWDFTPMAQALVLGVRINELQNRHRLRINETTAPADGATLNRTRIGFGTEETESAYFDWVPTYNVYDEDDVLVETNNVTSVMASYGLRNDHGANSGERFGIDYTNLFFFYENYGDNMTMVHDPTIGVDDSLAAEDEAPSFELGIILTAMVTFAVIVRRRN